MRRLDEPTTALTDYLMSVEAGVLGARLLAGSGEKQRGQRTLALGFLASALAAALGGTFHGLGNRMEGTRRKSLWNWTVLSIGVSATLMIGGVLRLPVRREDEAARWLISSGLMSVAGLACLAGPVRLHKHFNHNDLYHCLQMAGLYACYRGARLAGRNTSDNCSTPQEGETG